MVGLEQSLGELKVVGRSLRIFNQWRASKLNLCAVVQQIQDMLGSRRVYHSRVSESADCAAASLVTLRRGRRGRPKADIRPIPSMLWSKPALPPFAAGANFIGDRTQTSWTKRQFPAVPPWDALVNHRLSRKTCLDQTCSQFIQFVGVFQRHPIKIFDAGFGKDVLTIFDCIRRVFLAVECFIAGD